MGTALVLYDDKQARTGPRHTAGRVTEYSEAMSEAVCAHLRNGSTRAAASAAAGITRQTFYNWLNDERFGETFFYAVSRAEAEAENMFLQAVSDAALGKNGAPKDWRAGMAIMERRFDAWRQQIDLRKLDPAVLLQILQMQAENGAQSDVPAIEDAFDVL